MLEWLCRVTEWIKLQRVLWALVLVFASIGFVITAAAVFVGLLEDVRSPWVQSIVDLVRTHLQLDEEVANYLSNLCLALIFTSIPFVFIVCQQRKAVISALAAGYWKNYLRHFVGGDLKLVLIPPGNLITLETTSAVEQTKTNFALKWDVELREELIAKAGRTALVVYRDGERLPVAVDMCRNLAILGEVVENEIGKLFGGTLCTAETKFAYLSERYFHHLRMTWVSKMDLVDSIVILDGIDDERFSSVIASIPKSAL